MRLAALALACAAAASAQDFWTGVRDSILHNLGRPYVWGSTGMKSFDCSGFVWRVFHDNGFYMKRTTARKLYMSLKPVEGPRQSEFGHLVFFDNLKHVGIVNDKASFFHAQTSAGTNLSRFDPYWRGKVCGYRELQK